MSANQERVGTCRGPVRKSDRTGAAIFAAGALLLFAALPVSAITPAELASRLAAKERVLVIDVRSTIDYSNGHIPGAINIPLTLLPHKKVPTAQLIVVCGDGLGRIGEAESLALVSSRPGVNADVLEGGYAAWVEHTRLSTAQSGMERERIPGITYQSLVEAEKGDIVMVDLRAPGANPPAAQDATSSAARRDPVEAFAREIGVPLARAAGSAALESASADPNHYAAIAATSVAAEMDEGEGPGRLLVLVADSEAAANEAARNLRANGYYRFTILIGGADTIVHQGRTGTGRQGGELPVNANPQ